jgi:hypothetical protein
VFIKSVSRKTKLVPSCKIPNLISEKSERYKQLGTTVQEGTIFLANPEKIILETIWFVKQIDGPQS